jgi:sulfate transport system substrate-binding protein
LIVVAYPRAGASRRVRRLPSGSLELLNVSYDPTRELWRAINAAFIPAYEKDAGITLEIKQSHGGSSTQARAVIDGLDADVVTLALWSDTDAIAKRGLIDSGWMDEFPNTRCPTPRRSCSSSARAIRKGSRTGRTWSSPGVEIVTPNPKTSGNGQLSLYGAWGSVMLRGGTRDQAVDYVTRLYKQVPVLDSGARGATPRSYRKKSATSTWPGRTKRTWKSGRAWRGAGPRLIRPSASAPSHTVAVVDQNVDRRRRVLRRKPTSVSSIRSRRRRSSRSTSIARRMPPCSPGTRRRFPR